MNSLDLNAKSWHYFLATIGGMRDVDKSTDICTYTRKVIGGTLISVLLLAAGLIVLGSVVGTFVMWGYYHDFAFHADVPTIIRAAALVFYTLCSAMILIVTVILSVNLKDYLEEQRHRKTVEANPGFVRQAYRSFKDKVCWKINIS